MSDPTTTPSDMGIPISPAERPICCAVVYVPEQWRVARGGRAYLHKERRQCRRVATRDGGLCWQHWVVAKGRFLEVRK